MTKRRKPSYPRSTTSSGDVGPLRTATYAKPKVKKPKKPRRVGK